MSFFSGGVRALRRMGADSARDWQPWSNRFNLAMALAISVVSGLGGTWFVLASSKGVRTVQSGPWRAVIEIGSEQANPYARAIIARRGSAPMLAAELITFTTTNDSLGAPLRSQCVYQLRSGQIETRLWTLAVLDGGGHILPADGGRHQMTSLDVLREPDGRFEINLSERASPNNWLSTGRGHKLSLAMRLYDTPLFANGGLANLAMPEIVPVRCS